MYNVLSHKVLSSGVFHPRERVLVDLRAEHNDVSVWSRRLLQG